MRAEFDLFLTLPVQTVSGSIDAGQFTPSRVASKKQRWKHD